MMTLPLHDLPTRSASGFMLRYVAPRSFPPQLVGPLDRKQLFAQTIGPCILATGHGSPTEFAGHNNQLLMEVSDLPDVKGKTVLLLACETAQQLGPELIKAGAASFIGWKEDFVWVMDADLAATPWEDKWAEPALYPVMECMNMLLDGKTSREAFLKMLSSWKENLKVEDEDFVSSSIEFDLEHAVLLGDGNKNVRPTPNFKIPFPPPPFITPFYSP